MKSFFAHIIPKRGTTQTTLWVRSTLVVILVLAGLCLPACDISPVPTPIPGDESDEFGVGAGYDEEFTDEFGAEESLMDRGSAEPNLSGGEGAQDPGAEEGGEAGLSGEGENNADDREGVGEVPEASEGGEASEESADAAGTSEENDVQDPPKDVCGPESADTSYPGDSVESDAGVGESDAGCY